MVDAAKKAGVKLLAYTSVLRADTSKMTRVLTGKGHENRVYELAGDTRLTMEELAAEMARISGKPVSDRNLSPDQYRKISICVGVPEHFADHLVDSDAQAAGGALDDTTGELRRLIGRPTTTPAEAIRATLG